MHNEAFLQTILDLPKQIQEAVNLAEDITVQLPIENVVVTGMGGSGLPGRLLSSYADLPVPLIINNSYDMPKIVKSRSLVFAISYSGNTEETIAAFREARRKNARLVVICSGGKLEQLAKKENIPLIKVPAGIQPRISLAYMFFPVLTVLHNAKILPFPSEEITGILSSLKSPRYKDRAKALAEKLVDKIPLIYASEKFRAVAYKWKINFNENSKTHAFCNVFPELNHNELVGFTSLSGNYHVIMLQDEFDDRRVKERMKITKNIISQKGVDTTLIAVTGNSLLSRMFSAIHLGDLTSYYLAELRGIDPEPVEVVEDFKKKLGK
ncbi:bifunctional phosphoglucose/phosphomannose isomerase [Candidatus Woesearchaeota archaeon]|nr:bifunctional phosphoglucose/phosphomannose isomerase [Candidatus Woesearchaeota archaeon]